MVVDYRDSHGRRLEDYVRPSVAVDVAVLTVREATLHVLVVERDGQGTRLPGTFLHEGETLAGAAARALHDKAGLDGARLHQLGVFDDPDRDDRGWVISVGHGAAMPERLLPSGALLAPLARGRLTTTLQYDHEKIVARAVTDLRTRYGARIDPDKLLGREFTMLELRTVYEAVFGRALVRDTFRRTVREHLEETGRLASVGPGRPAALFRRRRSSPLPPSAFAFFVGGRASDSR